MVIGLAQSGGRFPSPGPPRGSRGETPGEAPRIAPAARPAHLPAHRALFRVPAQPHRGGRGRRRRKSVHGGPGRGNCACDRRGRESRSAAPANRPRLGFGSSPSGAPAVTGTPGAMVMCAPGRRAPDGKPAPRTTGGANSLRIGPRRGILRARTLPFPRRPPERVDPELVFRVRRQAGHRVRAPRHVLRVRPALPRRARRRGHRRWRRPQGADSRFASGHRRRHGVTNPPGRARKRSCCRAG